jgi:DNA topoisomerase VI subunit B
MSGPPKRERRPTGETAPHGSARRRPAPILERVAFKTSRLAEFCGQRELVAQTGHAVEDWPLVTLKELVDNALDAAEEAEIAPEVDVTVSTERGEIVIADNGPGIAAEIVRDVLDYSYRVSSREAYASPTRGAQGNALKTLAVRVARQDRHGRG